MRFSPSTLPVCLILLALVGGPAFGADLPNYSELSGYPALSPSPTDVVSDPWAGLYAGAGVSAWGGRGVKGGFGGDSFIGYDKAFDNGVIVSFHGSAGYAPFTFATPVGLTPFTGTSFAAGEATIGYRMGQVTPYVITGLALARPTGFAGGALDPGAALNTVFSGPGAVQAVGEVGIGAIYHMTPNFSMGIEARVYKANNGGLAGWPPY